MRMYSQPLIPPERIQEARRQWPALDVKDEVFSAHALSQLTARSTTAQLDALHLSDLYLCCACASGVAGAVEVFEQAHAALLTATVHRFSGLAHTSDDLRQIIRQRLFVAEPGLRPKIAEYAGRGPLSAWLRVTIGRTLLNLAQREHVDEPLDREAILAQALCTGQPEFEHLKENARAHFARAFNASWSALKPEQRLVLRHQYIDGLTLDEMARLNQVHAATISRRLAKARGDLLNSISQHVARELHLSPLELNSLIRAVRSGLDITLRSLETS